MNKTLTQHFENLSEKNTVLDQLKTLQKVEIEWAFKQTKLLLTNSFSTAYYLQLMDQTKEYSNQLFEHSLLSLFWSQLLCKIIENPDHRLLQCYGFAALFHDIGFLKLPSKLLHHPHQLSIHDWEDIYKHPSLSVSVMTQDPSRSVPSEVLCMIYQHHERNDGKGYPLGLIEGQVQSGAQLIKMSDALSALSAERAYRNAFSFEQILQILHAEVEKYDRQKVRILNQYFGKGVSNSNEINSFKL